MKKVVVITGAGSGLGAALARRYSELGHQICLLGRSEEKLTTTAESLSPGAMVYPVNVASKAEVAETISAISREVGPIDILINSAGVIEMGLAETLTEEAVHQMIDINLKGTIFVTQAVLPEMKQRNQGTIANVISTAGREGKVNESVYCASKFGVRGFTEALLAEVQDTAIHIFAAYMGGMKTEFWEGIFPEEQTINLMDPDDVADLILDALTSRSNLTVTEMTIKNKITRKQGP